MDKARNLHLDPFSGISGDMLVASLLDTGEVDTEVLKEGIRGIKLDDYDIDTRKVKRGGLSGTLFTVCDSGVEREMTCVDDIESILEDSSLSRDIVDSAKSIFNRLAMAEAKVHGVTPDSVHFHEVGAVDTMVDIVGTLLLLDRMDIERVTCSKVSTGTGFVETAHGRLPVPVPAVMELIKNVPVHSTGIESELVTPTGAALLTGLCFSFGRMPDGRVISVGYGAGKKELEHPNLLRAVIMETDRETDDGDIVIMECNIDDMNPEVYSYVMEKLMDSGALDVSLTPIYMKKNRPGNMLTVISKHEEADSLADMILKETSTFGVRYRNGHRYELEREEVEVDTIHGSIGVKIGYMEGRPIKFSPEYEDCARIARESGVALSKVYRDAKRAAEDIDGK